MESIKNYIWFICESQKFMEGHAPKWWVFIHSLHLGFGFCKDMKRSDINE